jgi:DNA-binding transcriptional MerR regulator
LENKAPDAFRTISEVAEELDLPQHVLRFWETRFRDIKPMKRGGGRRYYRPDDIELLRGIRHLLYGEGYTIRGVQRILREHGAKFVQAVWQDGAPQPPHGAGEDEEFAVESESATEALQEDRGLRGRLTSLIGRDLGDHEDDAPRRQEPPLRGAPEPQIEPVDRAIHGGAMPAPAPAPEPVEDVHPSAPQHVGPALSRDDLQRLRAALEELVECRRLIDSAGARAA